MNQKKIADAVEAIHALLKAHDLNLIETACALFQVAAESNLDPKAAFESTCPTGCVSCWNHEVHEHR